MAALYRAVVLMRLKFLAAVPEKYVIIATCSGIFVSLVYNLTAPLATIKVTLKGCGGHQNYRQSRIFLPYFYKHPFVSFK